jgi:hypothetical protein
MKINLLQMKIWVAQADSGLDPPPLGRSSSSSGGVHRVLKSKLAWCRDTHQCQDVLLSNQRRQNRKMGIDEFPLPVPPLDDDPFASLSVADIRPWRLPLTTMRMDPTVSMRKKRKVRKKTKMTSDLFGTVFLLFPF